MADDPADQILQIFNFSATTQQLPACANLFGICHRIIAGSWHIQGQCTGHLAHFTMQSLGNSRLRSCAAAKAKKELTWFILILQACLFGQKAKDGKEQHTVGHMKIVYRMPQSEKCLA
jgi:hypothetical protein